MRSRTRAVVGALVAGVLAVLSVVAAPPTTADPGGPTGGGTRALSPFSLSLVPDTGMLTIRDATESYLLEGATFAGTVDTDTGVISGGSLSTPPITFQQEAAGLPVEITARFSQVTPNAGTGSIDSDGNALFLVSLYVDLHINVADGLIVTDCRATPVNLTLASTAPYDPDTKRLTVAALDFTVPEVVSGDGPWGHCEGLVSGPVNQQLAGSGHSLALTLEGDITLPLPPGDPSATALTVTPAGSSWLGSPVVLVATVAPGPDAEETAAPTGFVDFVDGDRTLNTVALDGDGRAEFTTSALPSGTRQLTARYRGDENYASSSHTVEHLVLANPQITADLPTTVLIGQEPGEAFDLTVANTPAGGPIPHARLEVHIRRPSGHESIDLGSVISDGVSHPRVALEVRDGAGDWQPVPLTYQSSAWSGPVGPAGDGPTVFSLAPGATRTERLRLTFPGHGTVGACTARTCPGPVDVTFTLVAVDATGVPEETVATAGGTLILRETQRRPSSISTSAIPGPAIRQGNTLTADFWIAGTTLLPSTGGHAEFFLGGRRLQSKLPTDPEYRDRQPIINDRMGNQGNGAMVFVPLDMPPGAHTFEMRFSGDDTYLPSAQSYTVTVHPAVGVPYECAITFFGLQLGANANVVAHAQAPAVRPSGSEVTLDGLAVELNFDVGLGLSGPLLMQLLSPTGSTTVGTLPLTGIDLGFGPSGAGSAGGLTRTPAGFPIPGVDLDHKVVLTNPTGTATVTGAPGEVVPVTLDAIDLTGEFSGLLGGTGVLRCAPHAEAIVLDEVTIAGTTLAVEPGGPVRAGEPVTLTATVAPITAGAVEFLDGTTSLGVASVDASGDGTAVLVTTGIAAGDRELTARFVSEVLTVPSTVSEPVALRVVPLACPDHAEEGNGAVVRLAFLELLGRCPDAGGYAYWTGELDGGLSREAFARRIASTPEALGRVVDDAYWTILDRPAADADRTYWAGRLRAHGRYDQLLAELAASGEFWTAAGANNSGFVTRVYERILDRAPDADGLTYWVGRLNRGESRRVLVRTLAKLAEPVGVIVDNSYAEILGRAPGTAERNGAVTRLQSDGDRSGLYARLIGTAEFFTRAQTLPNPED